MLLRSAPQTKYRPSISDDPKQADGPLARYGALEKAALAGSLT
jgi:hypothetical protein